MEDILQKTKIILRNGERSFELKSFKSLSISSSITQKITTFNLSLDILDDIEVFNFGLGSMIEIYTSKRTEPFELIFKGIVETHPKSLNGILQSVSFTGSDELSRTQKVLLSEVYTNMKITDIIKDLMTKYMPSLPVGYIQPIDYKITVKYNDAFLYTVLENLCTAINYTFSIDLNGQVNFFELSSKTNIQPIRLNDYVKGSASFEEANDRLVNRLLILGGEGLSKDQTQIISTDGLNSTFKINHKPNVASSGSVEIYLDGVRQSVGIDGVTEGFTPCLLDFNNATIRFQQQVVDGGDSSRQNVSDWILPVGKKIKVVYRFSYQLKVELSDDESIQKFNYVFMDKIEFPNITDKKDLETRGREHLNKYSQPITSGSISTWKTDYQTGEIVLLDIETNGSQFINKYLQITSKTVSIVPNKLTVSLNFEERIGLAGVMKRILEDVQNLKESSESTIVEKISSLQDRVQIRELLKVRSFSGGFIIGKNQIGDKL